MQAQRAQRSRIEVDLSLSAHANARLYYDVRRAQQAKHSKTLDAAGTALRAAEKKAQAQLAQASESHWGGGGAAVCFCVRREACALGTLCCRA